MSQLARKRLKHWAWGLAGLVFLASFPATYWDWQGRYAFKLWLYWAQYAVLPAMLGLGLGIERAGRWGLACRSALLAGLALLFWAGQIEPHWLQVRSTTIQTQATAKHVKIALVSDIHWGLFVRDWQLRRLVNELNALDVDAIFVAGDWTYEPKPDLMAGFAPLAQLKKPVFAVLGNHDVEKPGPKLSQALRAALTAHGVQLMEGRTAHWQGWRISGLDDLWGGQPAAQIQAIFNAAPTSGSGAGATGSNRIFLTHQPDTAALLPKNAAQLTLAGHTHGGQVNIPIATPFVLKRTMRENWYDGLHATAYGQVFVTTGTGMVGLPLRFAMPPRIDVLHLKTLTLD